MLTQQEWASIADALHAAIEDAGEHAHFLRSRGSSTEADEVESKAHAWGDLLTKVNMNLPADEEVT